MHRGLRATVAVMLTGCGRLSFDERVGVDGEPPDPPQLDGDVPPTTIRIGARADADDESVADVVLISAAPDQNLGTHPDLHLNGVDGDQSLIWFGVAAATDQTVLSAQLHLSIVQFPPSSPVQMTASEITQAWVEGTSNFEVGAASYLERTPGVPWSTAGANVPGSREPTAVAAVMLPLASDVEFVLDLPPDLVNRWITAPNENFGLALQSAPSQYVELYSSDHPDFERRPLLVLTVAP